MIHKVFSLIEKKNIEQKAEKSIKHNTYQNASDATQKVLEIIDKHASLEKIYQ